MYTYSVLLLKLHLSQTSRLLHLFLLMRLLYSLTPGLAFFLQRSHIFSHKFICILKGELNTLKTFSSNAEIIFHITCSPLLFFEYSIGEMGWIGYQCTCSLLTSCHVLFFSHSLKHVLVSSWLKEKSKFLEGSYLISVTYSKWTTGFAS